jgi:hypothetical protein
VVSSIVMPDESDLHPINPIKVASHQNIPMHGCFKLKKSYTKGMKACGDDLKVEIVDKIKSDLL